MNSRDLMFLVMIGIISTTLVVVIVQWVHSRRGRDNGGNWWEGPWDDQR